MKKKIYVLMVSRVFPSYHPRKGEETGFPELIISGFKQHTVRPNYERWKKKSDQINAGKAVLSIRYWTGKPYCSPQKEFCELSSIEVQKVCYYKLPVVTNNLPTSYNLIFINNSVIPLRHPFKFAARDGLSLADLQSWFPKPVEDMALIHFGNFKY